MGAWLRLLAREGYRVADVLDRLNRLLLDDATEAADAAARALVAAGGPTDRPGRRTPDRASCSLLDGGGSCRLPTAARRPLHPRLRRAPAAAAARPDGTVRAVAEPQTLLGVVEDATYTSETFELRSGDTLLLRHGRGHRAAQRLPPVRRRGRAGPGAGRVRGPATPS
ncbi:hypothetical protein SVIOM74S_01090 [Streptomyces violarus]